MVMSLKMELLLSILVFDLWSCIYFTSWTRKQGGDAVGPGQKRMDQ